MNDRLFEGLRYVAGRFSTTRDEFRKAQGGPPKGAEMVLDGLRSHGLVNASGDRVAASESGLRALGALVDLHK